MVGLISLGLGIAKAAGGFAGAAKEQGRQLDKQSLMPPSCLRMLEGEQT